MNRRIVGIVVQISGERLGIEIRENSTPETRAAHCAVLRRVGSKYRPLVEKRMGLAGNQIFDVRGQYVHGRE